MSLIAYEKGVQPIEGECGYHASAFVEIINVENHFAPGETIIISEEQVIRRFYDDGPPAGWTYDPITKTLTYHGGGAAFENNF